MKKISSLLLAAFLSLTQLSYSYAQEHVVRSIGISVNLSDDGSARVREVWDLSVNQGTEWYLVRDNLGDISIDSLAVSDNGIAFRNLGFWDTGMSFEQKAGCCGILRKSNGCELCWGLGSYGDHLFTVEYTMTNVVKSMDDYDCLHIQFVSPGIKPRPQYSEVTITAAGSVRFDQSNTAIWSFGHHGSAAFENGAIVCRTEEAFVDDFESVIVLARFDKGLFQTSSALPGSFEGKLKEAFEDSDYDAYLQEEERLNRGIAATFIGVLTFLVGAGMTAVRKRNKKMFGVVKLKEINYSREIPFGGNLFESRYVLAKCGKTKSEANFASALILKMIKDGLLSVSSDSRGKVEICFAEGKNLDALSGAERRFYDMLYAASGSDHILQEKEFSRWSRKMGNAKTVSHWVEGLTGVGAGCLQIDGYTEGSGFTEAGQRQARNVIGFKKFLDDFTLSGERRSAEVALWQDYLIFASLYGIAKKVSEELKDINPQAFQEVFGYDYLTMNRVLYISNNMGESVIGSVARVQTASSVAGRGGASSFGGGRGFSGGGFGGGAR